MTSFGSKELGHTRVLAKEAVIKEPKEVYQESELVKNLTFLTVSK
jgi:hypothetical protein